MATSSGTCSLSVLTCYLSVLLCFFQVLDILWSDPNKQHGCTPNQRRGGGCYFGPDTTDQLLKRYNLKMLIRSHEFKPDGYDLTHNGKVRGCHGKLVNFTGTSTVDLSAELIRNMSNFFKMGLGELCTKLIDVRTACGVQTNTEVFWNFREWGLARYSSTSTKSLGTIMCICSTEKFLGSRSSLT